ncbi:MAG: hypothetical protein LBS38_02285 [Endomicrobium sp.]|jgi:hypothetical protein|nr:hypothetical protein [Endomicrobium sp.]
MRHLLKFIFGLFLTLTVTSNVFAYKEFNHFRLELAPQKSNYKYEEKNIMTILGNTTGCLGKLQYRHSPLDSFFVIYEFSYMAGDCTYNGAVKHKSHPPTPVQAKCIKNNFFENRLLLGFAMNDIDSKTEKFLYLGFGIRNLHNEIETVIKLKDNRLFECISPGQERESSYLYFPLGFDVKINISSWIIELNSELDFLLNGTQSTDNTKEMQKINKAFKENFSPLKATLTQDIGYGARTSIRICKSIGNSSFIFIEPFFKYWSVEESNEVNGLSEPKNSTSEYGAKIGLSF